MLQNPRQLCQQFSQKQLFQDHQHAIVKTPQHKVPAGAVPQTGQKPDHKQIHELMAAVSAHGDVHIVAEKAAHGNMPAPPEFGGTAGNVRIVKGLHIMKAEQSCETDGHIRVAGKVEIDLDGIHQNAEPCAGSGQTGQIPIQIAGSKIAGDVGDQHLFAQTDAEPGDPGGKILFVRRSLFDLGGHIGVSDDGSRHQLRIQGNVHKELAVAFLGLRLTAVYVDDVGNGLKGVKADADGQRDLRHRQLQPRQGVDRRDQHPAVLENTQKPQI